METKKNYNVVLTKIKSNHKNLRTDSVEGMSLELPKKGEKFILTGKPLTLGAGVRIIMTTQVKNVERIDDEILFHTLKSTYKLEIKGSVDVDENSINNLDLTDRV